MVLWKQILMNSTIISLSRRQSTEEKLDIQVIHVPYRQELTLPPLGYVYQAFSSPQKNAFLVDGTEPQEVFYLTIQVVPGPRSML